MFLEPNHLRTLSSVALKTEHEKLTQKCGANVFRYLIARLARLTQMRQFFVQHTFELKRDGRSGDVADECTRSIKIDKKRNPQID